ncbi:MAG: tripartite tricarboxylate transporter substrate binding protein [Proteobacteria bacterium]|nr:tripartite tricarboxylate transporter substrate binding protein [Pseudomonadota bacterium]
MNVDPRPGGSANTGTQAGRRAPADGDAWVFAASALTANASLYTGLWDPVKDVTGVGVKGVAPSVIAVPATLGVNDAQARVALAKREPRSPERINAIIRSGCEKYRAAILAGNIGAD